MEFTKVNQNAILFYQKDEGTMTAQEMYPQLISTPRTIVGHKSLK